MSILMLLSPAKTLDFTTPPQVTTHTIPDFLTHSAELVTILRAKSAQELGQLMGISQSLAETNFMRYQAWQPQLTPANAKQAILAFMGDVYEGLSAASLSAAQLDYVQAHVRVLSGLYGVLRPLDLILPYRLEMGTALATVRGKNLYAFWGDLISEALHQALQTKQDKPAKVLINLASDEYFKAVRRTKIAARIVSPVFQDYKNGQYKVISFYAKRARGLMARWAAIEGIECAEALYDFALEGYRFNATVSDSERWVFQRRQ